ncbi:NO-inducible flavohemoprotein [Facilibium subflavum]|uniref:NO-inducible flavohemoprotein n=1 Tax=Facilibium subflavum TaxID=2219058 RepID=UPI000E65939C|nr:NO-inducible flavohemoprotein [Facilibium subflavum]
MLSNKTIQIVKSTAPALAEKGLEITNCMYHNMLSNEPEIKKMFNISHQRSGLQPKALANAVYAYAQNIDNLSALTDAVEVMAAKHVASQIKAEHYPIVGKYLLAAIDQVLAPGQEILDAWQSAYQFLADILIAREHILYKQQKDQAGGWPGFREFIVSDKVVESDCITSFYLVPKDQKSIAKHLPGQYITISLDIPQGQYKRQYSISSVPNDKYYRISVKKENTPCGIVSNYLHEEIQLQDSIHLSAPTGNFYLKDNDKPVVLLSAGVGLTPMLSMLSFLLEQNPTKPIYFIHATNNSQSHAMRTDIDRLALKYPNLHIFYSYSQPLEKDIQHQTMHKTGRIDMDWLHHILPGNDCDYYFCGPQSFMQMVQQTLHHWQVPAQQINYEVFGPQMA